MTGLIINRLWYSVPRVRNKHIIIALYVTVASNECIPITAGLYKPAREKTLLLGSAKTPVITNHSVWKLRECLVSTSANGSSVYGIVTNRGPITAAVRDTHDAPYRPFVGMPVHVN